MVDDGECIEAITAGIASPFPKTGLELMWNASTFGLMAWSEALVSDNMNLLANGNRTHGAARLKELSRAPKAGQ